MLINKEEFLSDGVKQGFNYGFKVRRSAASVIDQYMKIDDKFPNLKGGNLSGRYILNI